MASDYPLARGLLLRSSVLTPQHLLPRCWQGRNRLAEESPQDSGRGRSYNVHRVARLTPNRVRKGERAGMKVNATARIRAHGTIFQVAPYGHAMRR